MRTALATESAFLISFSARNGIFRALDCTETFKNYIETRRYATWLALRGSSVFCNRSQRRGRRKSANEASSLSERRNLPMPHSVGESARLGGRWEPHPRSARSSWSLRYSHGLRVRPNPPHPRRSSSPSTPPLPPGQS
jgi:hypothetical protein